MCVCICVYVCVCVCVWYMWCILSNKLMKIVQISAKPELSLKAGIGHYK